MRNKEEMLLDKMKINEERLRELEKWNLLNLEEKVFKIERQKIYKDLLDDQIKDKVPYNIIKGPFQDNKYKDFYSPQIAEKKVFPSTLNPYEIPVDDHSYLYKNNIINVSPCK